MICLRPSRCLVEQNYDVGVVVFGSDATIESTVVRATLPNTQGYLGNGIAIQGDPATEALADVTVRGCLVEQNHGVGVFVAGSDATIDSCLVRDTAPNADMLFGDGITVMLGKAAILSSEVTYNERAGVASFGAQVAITGGVFLCNGFNIEGELFAGTPASFEGSSRWQCGSLAHATCTEIDGECTAAHDGLAAPTSLSPTDPVTQ